jgi:hypothetical protein
LIDADSLGHVADFGLNILNGRAAFGINNYTIISTTPINDGFWHYIVATRKMSTHQIKLYVDGVLEASVQAISSTKPLTASETMAIGMSQTGLKKFEGMMDDIKIHERDLTDTEVWKNFVQYPDCRNRPLSDFNGDCVVDFDDLHILTENWLSCGLWPPESCH